MSIKVKQAIESSLISIEQKTFDENTIRTLLISSREYIKVDSLIRELAHFIAHPNRNQGIFHRKVNSRYAKFKLVQNRVLEFGLEFVTQNITTEDELSDFMLSGVDVDKIESKLFKILYQDGLEDLPESHLLKYTGFTKVQAEKCFKEHYTQINDYHYLNVIKTEKMISLLKMFPEDEEVIKAIKNGTELMSKIRNTVDSLQKVIRGAIYFSSVFETEALSQEFKTCFATVLQTFKIDERYLSAISENNNDLMLCFMTLLHDSKFVFFDKNESRVSLRVYCTDMRYDRLDKELIYERGVLALYLACNTAPGKQITFPLFVSHLKIQNYIDKSVFLNSQIKNPIEEIPWITAKRNNDRLELVI